MKPRFAFVSLLESGTWGASEYLWSNTALEFARGGHAVLACTHGWPLRPAPLAALARNGVLLEERFPPCAARLRDFIASLRKASRPAAIHVRPMTAVIRHRPHLVLLSVPWPTTPGLCAWCEALQAALLPYAVLIHTHAGHIWPAGGVAKRLAAALHGAAAVYFVSNDNRALLSRQLGLDEKLTFIARNPLGIDRQTAPPWPTDSIIRLACVGRLDPGQKGQDILLDCLHSPFWHNRSLNVGVFGEGPARARLEILAADLPAGLVTFHGHVSNPAGIWETHQLLVFPSRFEGLGLAVAEAQLCGRPVVITDCAARELVIDNHTGFIAAAATATALQCALERAWTRRDDWPHMGANARGHMLSLLPENPGRDFALVLRGLVAKASGDGTK